MNLNDILNAMNKLGPSPYNPNASMASLTSRFPVYKSKHVATEHPVLQLSDKAPVSAKFRIEYNAWLRKEFGMKGDNEVFLLRTDFGSCAVMHPNTAAIMLRSVC